jgi:nicotinamidase-related amidase
MISEFRVFKRKLQFMKSSDYPSRRLFLKQGSLAGLGAVISTRGITSLLSNSVSFTEPKDKGDGILEVRPRYYRWHVDPGVEWLETNTGYANLDWKIPLSQAAIVLVDVWQRHYIRDTEERAEAVINNRLIPLINTCRGEGLKIIHCPSPPVAKLHPNWVNLEVRGSALKERSDWPPREFLDLSGPYKAYRRPVEPREEERQKLPPLTFHPKIMPVENEPVIATGEELHLYCRQQGILFLFFAGFNTNACIITRDYGTLQMRNRGYAVILIRDCTTGMESKDTQATLSQTNGAILFLEMFGQYSVASEEIITSLKGIA